MRAICVIQGLARVVRHLQRRRVNTAAIVLTLALGVGASVGMFSVLHDVVLRPLPYSDGDRLVAFYSEAQGITRDGFTGAETVHGLTKVPGVEETAYYVETPPYTFIGAGTPRQVGVVRVGSHFFSLFGLPAALGRTFVAADFKRRLPVAVLSHTAWLELTGGDPDVVGHTLRFEQATVEVVGVLPASFKEPADFGDMLVYLPLPESALGKAPYNYTRQLYAFGRLAPGASRAAVLRELKARLAAAAMAEYGHTDPRFRFIYVRLIDELLGNTRAVLSGLFAIALLVLLIASATAASLVAIRFEQRGTELELRRALGASRGRVVAEAAYELVSLAAAAAVGGVLIAHGLLAAMRPLAAGILPRAGGIGIDASTLLFAAAVTGATVLLTGAASLSTLWMEPGSRLRAGVPHLVAGGRRPALPPVAAVGMSAVALAAALALSVSLTRLSDVDPGFRTKNVVAAELGIVRRPQAQKDRFLDRLFEALRAIPGVRDAAAVSRTPTRPVMTKSEVRVPGAKSATYVSLQIASEHYDSLLGIAIRRGRDITAADAADAPKVAVINETLARRFFGQADPLGKTLLLSGAAIPLKVVGVVADRHNAGLRAPAEPEVIVSLRQLGSWFGTLLVRWTNKPPADWRKLLQTAVNRIDPDQPVTGSFALTDDLHVQTRTLRFFTFATNCFAALALLLCGLGINAVIAAMQQRRVREIGLRMALGASPQQASGLVLATAARIVGFGLVLAALLAVPTFRWLQNQFFGVGPGLFWALFTVAVLASVAAAVTAVLLPARRAARVAPMQALRYE